jgi:hypothetical protein
MENFNRNKYVLFIIVVLVLIAGYALMAGPVKTHEGFNDAIFSFRRLTLAPVLILGAFGTLVFVIFKKS